MATIGSLSVRLGLNPERFTRGIKEARSALSGLTKDLDASSRNVRTLGTAMAAVGGVPAFAIVAGSAANAAGAILALPAAAGVAGTAVATLKLATKGLGDVFDAVAEGDAEKFAEALEKIAPGARPAIRAMADLQRRFGGIQQTVQANVFRGLGPQITALGNQYLPMLRQGLGGVATSLNGLAREAIATAQTPFFRGAVSRTLAATSTAMNNLRPAVSGLMNAVAALVQAGLPYVQQLTQWISGNVKAAGSFLKTAEGAAWMRQKLEAGKQGLQDLATIVRNLAPVLGAMTATLVAISNAFNALPGPVQSVLAHMMGFGLALGLVMRYTAPLITVMARLGPALVRAAGALGITTTALRTAAMASLRFTVRMVRVAAVTVAKFALMAARAVVWAATMAAQWFIAMGPVGWVIGIVVALVALIIAKWDTVKRYTIAAWNAVKDAVLSAWNWIKSIVMGAVRAVVGFVRDHWKLLLGIITGPIGAAAMFVISHWDKIKAATVAAWNAVKSFVMGAVNGIRSVVMSVINAVVGFITGAWNRARSITVSAWNGLKNAVVSAANSMLGFVRSIPGRILGALGNLGSLLFNAGKRIIQGLINGIKSMIGSLGSTMSSVASSVTGFLPFSPAKRGPLRRHPPEVAGARIVQLLAAGIRNHRDELERAARRMAEVVRPRIADFLRDRGAAFLREHRGRIEDWLVDRGWTPPDHGASPGSAPQGPGREVNVVINNPAPEPASDSLQHRMSRLSALGMFT